MWIRLLYSLALIAIADILFIVLLKRTWFRGESLPKWLVFANYLPAAIYILWFLALIILKGTPGPDYLLYRQYFYPFGLFALIYPPKLLYLTIASIDVIRFRLAKDSLHPESYFRKNRFGLFAGVLAIALSGLTLYGIVIGKKYFTVKKVDLTFEKLPESFNGVKVAIISDLHLGSFANEQTAKNGLSIVNSLNPDIIAITGDIVNVTAEEILPFLDVFSEMKAPSGKYAVLGNHDLSDYAKWNDVDIAAHNILFLDKYLDSAGFNLLNDEHVILKRSKDSIALLGVMNCGEGRFEKTGDLKKAVNGIERVPFKILLSHDPSHWQSEVLPMTDIDLTLSGHTHGLQTGVRIGNFRLSPAMLGHSRWLGLYEFNQRYLYINAGFGYLGFPGRVGIRPEITLLTLYAGPKK